MSGPSNNITRMLQRFVGLSRLYLPELIYKALVLVYAGLCFFLAISGMPAELAGFSVAGALSLVFLKLNAFSEFGGAGFTARMKNSVKELKRAIEPITSKETEPDRVERLPGDDETSSNLLLEEDHRKVLIALTQSKYSWRTIGGIAKDANLNESMVPDILFDLEQEGMAVSGKSSSGLAIWGSTMKGYIHVALLTQENRKSSA